MRFKLVEGPNETPAKTKAEWPPSRSTLDAYSKLRTTDEQVGFLKRNILPHKVFREKFGIRPIIIDSIQRHGLNPSKNFFLDFITKLKVPFEHSSSRPNVQYLYDSYMNKKLDLQMPVLQNPTLYNRKINDFKYTLNAFYLFSNPKKAGAYLKNTDVINVTEFLSDGTDLTSDQIKPAGIGGEQGDTIFNVIEGWANDNEYSPKEIEDRKQKLKDEEEKKKNNPNDNGPKGPQYVLEDVVPSPWKYETFKEYIELAFKHKGIIKPSSDKESYLNKLYIALEYPNLVTATGLQEVQSTPNKILNKSVDKITEDDVKSFGDPVQKPDEPIYVKVIEDGTTKDGVSGVFVFHKFIPLTKENIGSLKQQSAKYRKDMELKTFVMANDKTIEKLKGIIAVLDQVG